MEIRLSKCPFCGEDVAEMSNAHDLEECGKFEDDRCPCEQYEDAGKCQFHTVVCNMNKGGCGASSGYFATEERAAQAWNNRAYLVPPPKISCETKLGDCGGKYGKIKQ